MARRVNRFEYPRVARRYDWANWTDTHAWEIFRGEDYDIPTESMRVNLHDRANREGLKVRTTIIRHADRREGLRFQFYLPENGSSLPPIRSRSADWRYPVNDPRRFRVEQ